MSNVIPSVTKSNIIDALLLKGNIFGKVEILTFLMRIWDLENMPSTDYRKEYNNAYRDIWKHMIMNDDWTIDFLFRNRLDLINANDELFFIFLQEVVHPSVRPSAEVEDYVNSINDHLNRDGYKLDISGEISGYPVYNVIKINDGVIEKVKNLIFAADGPKPEIVLSDSISNNIQIVRNEKFCLIYDSPISSKGLLWEEMGFWWAKKNGLKYPDRETSNNLYLRLSRSLDSEPEKLLFSIYYSTFSKICGDSLPALIPQVYLHYDPYTQKELKGVKRLERQRMDFLLLLSSFERIVIEVDGKQHYSDDDRSSPKKYSEMVSADRLLRLKGYEVYRFGGFELSQENGSDLIIQFFENLFIKHGIIKK